MVKSHVISSFSSIRVELLRTTMSHQANSLYVIGTSYIICNSAMTTRHLSFLLVFSIFQIISLSIDEYSSFMA